MFRNAVKKKKKKRKETRMLASGKIFIRARLWDQKDDVLIHLLFLSLRGQN